MFEHVDKHKATLAFGVVAAVVLLVMFMKQRGASQTAAAVPSSSGAAALVGGYTTAQTVYVPTTSYDIHYETNNGTIQNSTVDNKTTTTYAPVNSPVTQNSPSGTFTGSPIIGNPSVPVTGIVTHPVVVPPAPIIKVLPNPTPPPAAAAHPIQGVTPHPAPHPVKITKPVTRTPAPAAAPQKVAYKAYGSTALNSSLWGLSKMYLMNHKGEKTPSNAQIQQEVNHVVAVNHVKNPNSIQKGQTFVMN